MARPKKQSDAEVLAHVRKQMARGEASFRKVAFSAGLAPSTLVQRFGTAEAMVGAALAEGWGAALIALTGVAASDGSKGAPGFLKALGLALPELPLLLRHLDNPAALGPAAAFQAAVVAVLAEKLGEEEAEILFAAWIGQALWLPVTGKSFRLRDVVRRL